LYRGGSKATIETLEKLFEYLGRRTGPRAYFRTRAGTKRYISRHVFWGRLRGLLLSENPGDRAIVLPPYGLWFSGEIFIEAAPEDIISALKPKRRGGPGREPKYAYADAMIDLIDNPELADIDLGDEIAARRKVEALLVAWFQTRADESGDAPRSDMIRPYAEKVVKRLWIRCARHTIAGHIGRNAWTWRNGGATIWTLCAKAQISSRYANAREAESAKPRAVP